MIVGTITFPVAKWYADQTIFENQARSEQEKIKVLPLLQHAHSEMGKAVKRGDFDVLVEFSRCQCTTEDIYRVSQFLREDDFVAERFDDFQLRVSWLTAHKP